MALCVKCVWRVGGWVDQKIWSSGKFPIRDIVVQGDDLDDLDELEELEEVEIL